MPVMSDALLNQVENVTQRPTATVANLHEGGQLGVGPHLSMLDASTPLVFSPAVAIVTHVPTMFSSFPMMGKVLKALVERHAKTITGVDWGTELEEASAYVLPDGQEVKIPTKTKRSAIAPNMTFAEVPGNLVWSYFNQYINMINQADTHHSKLAAMVNDDGLDPFVFSSFCFDFILINFDPTMLPKNIIDATFVTTCYPRATGMLNVKREIGVSETPERSIDFSGIVQHGGNVYQAAVNIAESLQLHKANFDNAPAIATEIDSRAQDLGQEHEIANILRDFNVE